ncbi:MAG: hypothetical protein HYU39_09060 [Thaumarchaeota archaeon]|nr:hypothetical protein [Nitrososphaerota archaeon]
MSELRIKDTRVKGRTIGLKEVFPAIYEDLHSVFHEEVFSIGDACGALMLSREEARNALRRLRGQLLLFSFMKGKYRLLSHVDARFARKRLVNLNRVKSTQHVHLIVKALGLLHQCFPEKLFSACLYGSAAKGDILADSNVELLVVLENEGRLVDRVKSIYQCVEEIGFERRFLLKNGLAGDISIYPLTKEEAKRFHPIYLDVAEEGIILYDTEGFFQRLQFQSLGTLINSGGVKFKSKERWFWRMPADFSFGDPIGIPRLL